MNDGTLNIALKVLLKKIYYISAVTKGVYPKIQGHC
jgi:hypothetical protein